ncbi:AraC family transcriptional regulator [Paenibacillus sp. Leaf72]|uniref:AraC family transcriptional regulator n=1 Tax=Paenibacillus sp. Leaf72 TaxID=1736234 RepID=UPI0006FD56DE|nr:AraC family transcriptional regulator [Paenibacillus sp. Leaf72]KQN97063.1 hypothetical protein ASF12_23640 [Paenibacillus sp. Leaf72]
MEITGEHMLNQQFKQLKADVMVASYSKSPAGWIMRRAEPDYFCLCYVDKGEGWLEMNETQYKVSAGRLYLLRPGWARRYGSLGDNHFIHYWCHFRAEMAAESYIHLAHLPLEVEVKDAQIVKQLFTKMLAAQEESDLTGELRTKAVLFELIALFMEDSRTQNTTLLQLSEHEHWNDVLVYDEVLNFIEENLKYQIPIGVLARLADLSAEGFHAAFKNKVGCSLVQYITQRRIATAKKLLRTTNLPIAAIAAEVGMLNHYLSRLFKQQTGITPSEYRRIICSSAWQEAGQTDREEYRNT